MSSKIVAAGALITRLADTRRTSLMHPSQHIAGFEAGCHPVVTFRHGQQPATTAVYFTANATVVVAVRP